ncbi:MAG: phage tail assembly chaperone [Novosphingobium sp.]
MSGRFGPGAARLSGLAARLLGWRPDHFWHATPAELAAVLCPYTSPGESLARGDLERMMEQERCPTQSIA